MFARRVLAAAVRVAPRVAAATAVAAAAAYVAAPVVPVACDAAPKAAPVTRQRSFVALKPDAVQRGLIGEIIARFEKKGYKLVAMKFQKPTKAMAEAHYSDLAGKPFFNGLTDFFSSGPIVCMVWEGDGCIKGIRQMLGTTNPVDSLPGSIRGDYCVITGRNIIHASDGTDSAAHEIAHWFTPAELVDWEPETAKWVYEKK